MIIKWTIQWSMSVLGFKGALVEVLGRAKPVGECSDQLTLKLFAWNRLQEHLILCGDHDTVRENKRGARFMGK